MRIPPLYKLRTWQMFFAGAAIGGVLSWIIFLYMYGVYHEQQTSQIAEQKLLIQLLERDKHLLLEDQKKLNEQNKRILTIQDIRVTITNHDNYDLDSLTVHALTTAVRDDLRDLLTKDIQSVAKNKALLKKAIENKVYERDDRKYLFKVDSIYFDTVLEIALKIMDK